jgi:hypothetical protein
MNIFFLDLDVVKCAEYHNDKHCVKMILEYAQLLSTAHHLHPLPDFDPTSVYKKTHVNHPCAVWARASTGNYEYLLKLLIALFDEYTDRYGKSHATMRLLPQLRLTPNLKINRVNRPPCCMPDECKLTEGVVASYRNYYMTHKRHIATWRNGTPDWWQ